MDLFDKFVSWVALPLLGVIVLPMAVMTLVGMYNAVFKIIL